MVFDIEFELISSDRFAKFLLVAPDLDSINGGLISKLFSVLHLGEAKKYAVFFALFAPLDFLVVGG